MERRQPGLIQIYRNGHFCPLKTSRTDRHRYGWEVWHCHGCPGSEGRFLPSFSFTRFNRLAAQANSSDSIARPIGITITAGPGITMRTTPMASTVKPITAMISRLTCLRVKRSSLVICEYLRKEEREVPFLPDCLACLLVRLTQNRYSGILLSRNRQDKQVAK